jgi:hypothetical protein
MNGYPGPVNGTGRQSRSGLLNAAMLAMVKRAFEALDEEGLTFGGLPSTYQKLDALELLDALALAAQEAIEQHAPTLPDSTVAGMRAAVEMLWQASAVSAKMRQVAASPTPPTLNDIAEVALLAASAGASQVDGAMASSEISALRRQQIESARAARTRRAQAAWERQILEHCQERVAQLPNIDSKMLATTVCARNGIPHGKRPHVQALIDHWRRNGDLQAPKHSRLG